MVFLRHHIASGCIHRKAASYLGGPAPKERARITILFGCHQFLCLVYSKRGHDLIITQQPFTKGCSMEMNEGLSTKCSRISLKNSSRRPRYSLNSMLICVSVWYPPMAFARSYRMKSHMGALPVTLIDNQQSD